MLLFLQTTDPFVALSLDITWPGNSPAPPVGLPEKVSLVSLGAFKNHKLIACLSFQFSMRVSWLEEAPFINYVPPDNETGECKMSRAVPCYATYPNNR